MPPTPSATITATQTAVFKLRSPSAWKRAVLDAIRLDVFKGETLRGLLLTTYGFSEFGTKAGQAATVAYSAAALMLLLTLAGFAHAFLTPATVPFAAVEPKKQPTGKPITA